MLVIEGLVELGLVVVIAISRMQARIGKNNSSPVYFSGSYFPPTSTTTSHLSIISLSRVRMIARKGGIEKGQKSDGKKYNNFCIRGGKREETLTKSHHYGTFRCEYKSSCYFHRE